MSNDEHSRFVRQHLQTENRFILFADVLVFGFCFMSWGAVFGLALKVTAIFGATIGALIWLLVRRNNIYGYKMISTTGGVGCFLALLGAIAWIVKAII